jgi:hypothetical protein
MYGITHDEVKESYEHSTDVGGLENKPTNG